MGRALLRLWLFLTGGWGDVHIIQLLRIAPAMLFSLSCLLPGASAFSAAITGKNVTPFSDKGK